MKPLVIYHDNCADGFGAAFAAWLKFGDEAEYFPAQHGKTEDEYIKSFSPIDREVYILDFSFTKSIMDQIFDFAKKVIWLDHHKTAFEMWCPEFYAKPAENHEYGETHYLGKHYIRLNNNKSGAMLAWEYFLPDAEVPMLICHIDDRDRWQFKIPGSRELNATIWSYA